MEEVAERKGEMSMLGIYGFWTFTRCVNLRVWGIRHIKAEFGPGAFALHSMLRSRSFVRGVLKALRCILTNGLRSMTEL